MRNLREEAIALDQENHFWLKIRENRGAARANSPWAAYDVLGKHINQQKGRVFVTLIHKLGTEF